MEMEMEFTKKTTSATRAKPSNGHVSKEDRVRALDGLRRLSLPVGSPRKMKQESVQPIKRERSWTITAV